MSSTLYYIFDPLCGWCYGASATVSALARVNDLDVQLLPSGLFSGEGARQMDDAFATYALANDQRIERLTGQRFTERYRSQVLADRRQMFDSGPATVALTAVALSAPQHEPAALKAIQLSRFVAGEDVTQIDSLTKTLELLELNEAATRLARMDVELLNATRARTAKAQALLSQFGARGVPTFILEVEGHRQMLQASSMYANPQAFLDQVASARARNGSVPPGLAFHHRHAHHEGTS